MEIYYFVNDSNEKIFYIKDKKKNVNYQTDGNGIIKLTLLESSKEQNKSENKKDKNLEPKEENNPKENIKTKVINGKEENGHLESEKSKNIKTENSLNKKEKSKNVETENSSNKKEKSKNVEIENSSDKEKKEKDKKPLPSDSKIETNENEDDDVVYSIDRKKKYRKQEIVDEFHAVVEQILNNK